MFDKAFDARQHALSLAKDPRVDALAEAYRHTGYKGYLLKQTEFEQTRNLPYTAHIYALLNDEPHALDALEAAYKQRNGAILFMRTAPEFDSIRSSPRFRGLVDRFKFPNSASYKNWGLAKPCEVLARALNP
jgi:hypothetical protein